MTLFPAGHKTTASDFAALIPLKAVRLTNTSGAIGTTSGTTELNLSAYALTGLTLTSGRYYMIRYGLTFTKSVAGDTFDFKLRVNTAVSGTQIGQVGFNITDALAGGYREFGLAFVGDSSYTALYLSAVRSGGTGTLSYYGALAGSPVMSRAFATLHDLGDTDNWTDVP